ncbi:alpha/beta hydrolase [Brevibacillus sp. 7WMA2]|uniref:alpha/beta hydrolase family protein n=1 Tax=Brevibacillus TaxID=55080 RepID=UPI0013A70E11|nr:MULTISPECIES: alpha/beta fold hydrolase [Brevibacillus]MCR8996874.1 lysophospholipase [Brevibacillus laterosporus]QIC04146.1 alpha/beta hydrolase [Brevibacillus sp. 7WMA2]WPS89277.1 alpha/beta fold hydrolase [Brevibacillus halotolerans]
MKRHVEIKWQDETLAATLYVPELENQAETFPLIVICHGFIGSRIGVNRLFVETATQLIKDGYAVLCFDYVGCGESTGEYGHSGFDQLVAQTRHVLQEAAHFPEIDSQRISLLGHSLGGPVALYTAISEPNIRKLMLWSPVAHPYKDIVRIVGVDTYQRAWQHTSVDYMGYGLTLAFFESLHSYVPLKELQKYAGDVFIAHGTADIDIPVEYCFHYYYAFRSRSTGKSDKEIILEADHTFSDGCSRTMLIDSTREWLSGERYYKQSGGAITRTLGYSI